jgi:hypothetical protein
MYEPTTMTRPIPTGLNTNMGYVVIIIVAKCLIVAAAAKYQSHNNTSQISSSCFDDINLTRASTDGIHFEF